MPRRPSTYELRCCSKCSAEFLPTHGAQKLCGPTCRDYRAGGAKTCGGCGAEFFAVHRNRGYCSETCREGAWAYQPRRRPCERCGVATPNARFCSEGCARAKPCRECGVEFEPAKYQRSCEDCLAAKETHRPFRLAVVLWGRCPGCDRGFEKRAASQTCCSISCANRFRFPPKPVIERLRVWTAGFCRGCGEPFVSSAAHARYCSESCERRVSRQVRKDRRRARLKSQKGQDVVYRRKVFERDGWVCRLCRKPVKRDALVPHPKAPTLDHILPLALGGLHDYANVQCAHFICNSRKSAYVTQLSFAA